MTINDSIEFIYADESSDEHEVVLGNFGSTSTESNDEDESLVVSTTPYIERWHFHGVQKNAPLKFPITIFQPSGKFIDADKERELKRWLCKKDGYHWLQIKQDDLYDIFYHAILMNPRKESVGKYSGGMTFDVINSSCHAWSKLYTKNYTCSGTLSFKFYNVADYEDYELRPKMIISPTADGVIKIQNETTGVEIVINSCSNGEVITLDGLNGKIKSSLLNRILIDDWNKKFISMINSNNNITLTGNFILRMEYRMPIRIGG